MDVTNWLQFAREVRQFAVDMPDERRIMLQSMYDTIGSAVDDQYWSYPGGGEHELPPAFSGEWGRNTRIWIQPQAAAISVRNNSKHAAFMEYGRPPGPLPLGIIEQWARDKLGNDSKRVAKAIWKKLMNRGYEGMHTLYKATNPYSDGVGPSLHAELGHILEQRLRTMIYKHGWR